MSDMEYILNHWSVPEHSRSGVVIGKGIDVIECVLERLPEEEGSSDFIVNKDSSERGQGNTIPDTHSYE